jgi:hypothetical protein
MLDQLERATNGAATPTSAHRLSFPPEIEQVFREFRCAEMTTIGKDGMPLAWPIVAIYRPERGYFVTTTSISLPQKAYNARRNGKVSLLYSDPTASGLSRPPAVLVQGDATVSKEVHAWNDDLRCLWEVLAVRQPPSNAYSKGRLMRWLMDWYYLRLLTYIVPRRVHYWADGNVTRPAREIEVCHVG